MCVHLWSFMVCKYKVLSRLPSHICIIRISLWALRTFKTGGLTAAFYQWLQSSPGEHSESNTSYYVLVTRHREECPGSVRYPLIAVIPRTSQGSRPEDQICGHECHSHCLVSQLHLAPTPGSTDHGQVFVTAITLYRVDVPSPICFIYNLYLK